MKKWLRENWPIAAGQAVEFLSPLIWIFLDVISLHEGVRSYGILWAMVFVVVAIIASLTHFYFHTRKSHPRPLIGLAFGMFLFMVIFILAYIWFNNAALEWKFSEDPVVVEHYLSFIQPFSFGLAVGSFSGFLAYAAAIVLTIGQNLFQSQDGMK